MKTRYWAVALCVLVLVLALVSACTCGAASTATQTATATSTKTATATTTATATATQTATSTKTATATATATTTPTPTQTGNSLSNILGLGAGITSVKYDMNISTPNATMVSTVWEKGKKYREEITEQGVSMVIIIDMDAGVYYMSSGGNMWTAMTLDTSMVPVGANEDPSSILQYNPQITGTETIDGKSCTVITYDIPGTGTLKEWIWTDKGFPLKMETTTSQGTTTIEFTNIDFSDISDSQFELPDGAIVTTIGA